RELFGTVEIYYSYKSCVAVDARAKHEICSWLFVNIDQDVLVNAAVLAVAIRKNQIVQERFQQLGGIEHFLHFGSGHGLIFSWLIGSFLAWARAGRFPAAKRAHRLGMILLAELLGHAD